MKRKLTKSDAQEAKRLYVDQGWTLQMIGKHFGMTRQGIHQRLKKERVKFRPGRMQPKPFNKKKIVRLHVKEELSLTKISHECGAPFTRVRQTLIDAGVEPGVYTRRKGRLDPIHKLQIGQATIVSAVGRVEALRYSVFRITQKTGRRFTTRKIDARRLRVTRTG